MANKPGPVKTQAKAILAALLLSLIFCAASFAAQPNQGRQMGRQVRSPFPYYDCHVHLLGLYARSESDWPGAAQKALASMERLNTKLSIIMPPPFTFDQRHVFDVEEMVELAKAHPKRLAFLAGGGSLNVMIQKAAHTGETSPELRERFRQRAFEILEMGALGFGEMSAEHFSFHANHPYESSPPDHPLFLLLAEIAGEKGVPIDLHMEAVRADMPRPSHLSEPNPAVIPANLPAFERLLAHDRRAKIIWAHAGWGHTGQRTPELVRGMLSRHPNLYMSIKIRRRGRPESRMLVRGVLRPQWLKVMKEFPDRFFIGSDAFYITPWSRSRAPKDASAVLRVLEQLPPDLARQIGVENPRRIFKLP